MNQKLRERIEQQTDGYFRILIDLYLQQENKEWFKVDMLIIHETGLYVIKTEEEAGEIYGDEREFHWIRTAFIDRHNTYFDNPLSVNRLAIQLLLRNAQVLPSNHFHSWIVFSDQCKLRDVHIHSSEARVMQEKDIIDVLQEQWHSEPFLYRAFDIDIIYQFFLTSTQVSKRIKKKYRKQVEEKRIQLNSSKRPRGSKFKPIHWFILVSLLIILGVGFFIINFI